VDHPIANCDLTNDFAVAASFTGTEESESASNASSKALSLSAIRFPVVCESAVVAVIIGIKSKSAMKSSSRVEESFKSVVSSSSRRALRSSLPMAELESGCVERCGWFPMSTTSGAGSFGSRLCMIVAVRFCQ
jgi:hypothetical protein